MVFSQEPYYQIRHSDPAEYDSIKRRVAALDVPQALRARGVVYNFTQLQQLPARMCNESNRAATLKLRVKQRKESAAIFESVKKQDEQNERSHWAQHATDAIHLVIQAFELAQIPLILAAGLHNAHIR